MTPLQAYHKKRNFKKTSEPKGRKPKKKPSKKLLYVIQKHAASHLHYDLRLELEGVLKSWAVPKGPSLDPSVKRLAVHVEDHPLEYGGFEGIIPEGEYGGGTVMLWDTGEWQIEQDDPVGAYKKGRMTFLLKGKKLKGLWSLVQLKNNPKNWLLIKVKDKYARSESEYDITEAKPLSVLTRRTMDGIANLNKKIKKTTKKMNVTNLISAKKTKIPKIIFPQLATLVDNPPQGDQWLHEIKLDGYRLICFIQDQDIKLMTRRGQNWTNKFKNIVKEIKRLKIKSAVLDGEVVAIDQQKRFNFQLLQNTIHDHAKGKLIYYVFDLIYYDGHDLSKTPLIERKKILFQLLNSVNSKAVIYNDHIMGHGEAVFKEACQMELEGIVSKRVESHYVQKRTKNWLKVKCKKRQEFVVGGFTKSQGRRKYFGSLLLGVYEDHQLQYCGHVGTGFTESTLESMAVLLQKYKTDHMPFKSRPPDVKQVTWVEPRLVVEVEFSDWTDSKILRMPSFKGLREEKQPRKMMLEKSHAVSQKKSGKKSNNNNLDFNYPLTNPEKILYPEGNITKLQLARYYETIHEWMLPYIINRPLTLLRCPQGIEHKCFYQKHLHETTVESLHPVKIKEKDKIEEYLYLKNGEGLIALVQLGVLEIHAWNCHVDDIEKPDMIVFDLDPAPDVMWKKVIHAAVFVKEQLEKLKLKSFVRTTGGKGLHVVVPIIRQYNWDEVTAFAHAFVDYLVALEPDNYVGIMTKSKRKGKIYIDYLRNQRGATSIASYSTRAKGNAPVATPLSWDELSPRIKSTAYTIENLPSRLAKLKKDPWKDFFKIKQRLKLKNL